MSKAAAQRTHRIPSAWPDTERLATLEAVGPLSFKLSVTTFHWGEVCMCFDDALSFAPRSPEATP